MFKAAVNENLQQSVLEEAFQVVRKSGISAIRMRELAANSGCSVGTLYNLFENLDEIHFHVNARTFSMLFNELFSELERLHNEGVSLEEILPKLGWVYIAFGKEHFNLWKALFELTPEGEPPGWYRSRIVRSFEKAESFLSMAFNVSAEKASKILNYFWFSIHGVSSILLHKRATNQSDEFMNSYVEHCLKGIYELA